MLADTSLRTHTSASALHLLATAVKDSLKPTHKQMVLYSHNSVYRVYIQLIDLYYLEKKRTLWIDVALRDCWFEEFKCFVPSPPPLLLSFPSNYLENFIPVTEIHYRFFQCAHLLLIMNDQKTLVGNVFTIIGGFVLGGIRYFYSYLIFFHVMLDNHLL